MHGTTNDASQSIKAFSHIGILGAQKYSGASGTADHLLLSLSASQTARTVSLVMPLKKRMEQSSTTISATAICWIPASRSVAFGKATVRGKNVFAICLAECESNDSRSLSRSRIASLQYLKVSAFKPSCLQNCALLKPLVENRAIASRQNCSFAASRLARYGICQPSC